MNRPPAPLWNAHFAGLMLGLGLLLTFVLTGHGLGASGFPTAVAATAANVVAPTATAANDYLGPMVEGGSNPLDAWITWQVIGVAAGALLAAILSGGFRWQVDGPPRLSRPRRLLLAVIGGMVAGYGARVAAGCTSGLGLSGAATLATAGFLFLGGFFGAGLATGFLTRRYWQ